MWQSAVPGLEEQRQLWSKDEEQWAGEKLSYAQHPWHVGLITCPLGAKDEYSGLIAAEERDRSSTNMWQRIYLGPSTFLRVKGFAQCLSRRGSVMCLQCPREERKTEFQL